MMNTQYFNKAREPVVLAQDFYALIEWYERVLGFQRVQLIDDAYRYAILEVPGKIRIGFGEAKQMGIEAPNPTHGTVRLQWEVQPLEAFMEAFQAQSGTVVFGPSRDAADGYMYGAIRDIEGNEIWLVDENCP